MDCRRDIDIEREERKKVRGNSYTSSWMSRVERGKVWQMLKAPPLKSSDPHFLVIKSHCQTYFDNIGPKFKKPSFAILGVSFY